MRLYRNLLSAIVFSNTMVVTSQVSEPGFTNPFVIGEIITFNSTSLEEKRVLNVYLPVSYKTNKKDNYPVIYLLDGSIDEDIIHVSGLVQYGSFSWINSIPESIVVGIANVDRRKNFTFPTTVLKDKQEFPTSGESAKFIDFLKNEVKPLIAKNFRITESSTLIGQSLGGLLATEILLKQPEMFNNYVIVSPSLWWDNLSLLKIKLPKTTAAIKTVIAVGSEGDGMIKPAKRLNEKLSNDASNKFKSSYLFYDNKNHYDIMHEAIYDALKRINSKEN